MAFSDGRGWLSTLGMKLSLITACWREEPIREVIFLEQSEEWRKMIPKQIGSQQPPALHGLQGGPASPCLLRVPPATCSQQVEGQSARLRPQGSRLVTISPLPQAASTNSTLSGCKHPNLEESLPLASEVLADHSTPSLGLQFLCTASFGEGEEEAPRGGSGPPLPAPSGLHSSRTSCAFCRWQWEERGFPGASA